MLLFGFSSVLLSLTYSRYLHIFFAFALDFPSSWASFLLPLLSLSLCWLFSLFSVLSRTPLGVAPLPPPPPLPPLLNLMLSLSLCLLFTVSSLHLCLRWEPVLCDVVSDGHRRLHSPNVQLPETPEDGEHLAAEWVGGGESCRDREGSD